MGMQTIAGILLAAGMVFSGIGVAHDVPTEHEGCNPKLLCPQQIACVILDGERVAYPTLCGASNCNVHSHDLTYCPVSSEKSAEAS